MSEVSDEVVVAVPVKSPEEVREDHNADVQVLRGYRPPHLPTFGSKTPKVRKAGECASWFKVGCSTFIIMGWVIVLVKNQVEVWEIERRGEDPGEAETWLYNLSVTAVIFVLFSCCILMLSGEDLESKFFGRNNICSETDFHTELGRIQKLRPELKASVNCYHIVRRYRENGKGDTVAYDEEVSTFTTSGAQNVIDFVDVSPIVHFKKGKPKRFVCVNFKYEFESLDEATENEFGQLKDHLKKNHENQDDFIRICDDYKVPGGVTTEDIMVDRDPTKPIPCWVRNLECIGCCSLLSCWGYPWLLWLHSNIEFIEYPNKKLLSSTPIDEEYKEYIESERENYSINV